MLRTIYAILLTGFITTGCSQPQSYYKNLNHCLVAGTNDSAYCGKFPVFENRTTKQGRKIGLKIIVIPAIDQTADQPPIFYLEGGPGVAATSIADFYSDKHNPYRQKHDIVLIDIRGTGGSNPLHCYDLEYEKGIAKQFDKDDPDKDMYSAKDVKACYDSLSKIADLTHYTTTNVVNDIEEARQWLGYKKIHLYGLSYGTRVAHEYMRRFPSSIETVVLWSPAGVDTKMPLYHAKFAQQSLDKLFNDCSNDPLCKDNFPSLSKEFNALMRSGKQQHFKTTHTFSNGTKKELSIPWDIFQTRIRRLMYNPAGLRQVPFIIHEAYSGNWRPFLSLYKENGRYNGFIAEGLYLCITCSEDVPFIKKEDVELQTKNTYMGDYRVVQQQIACANWVQGGIPGDFTEPVQSGIPVLILSGEYDPVTPVSLAREIAKHLSKSQLVIIPEMSHAFDGLSNEVCFDNMVIEFMSSSGKKVNTDCIATMKPPDYRVRN